MQNSSDETAAQLMVLIGRPSKESSLPNRSTWVYIPLTESLG